MQAIARTADGLALVERPVPTPPRGSVLVRMRAAPINPNDLMALADSYEVARPIGSIPGFEGCGTVVAAGDGVMGRFLLGREVACAAGEGDGTWAEYAVVEVMKCAPLDKRTDPLQAAMLLTNPMTAQVLLDTARRGGHRALVQNAAAGSIGKMLARLCVTAKVPLVNIVRRPEQAEVLRALGAEHVVIASTPGADAELAALCGRLGVTFGFDAIAGTATGQLASAIALGGTILVYGMLSGAPVQLDANTLVFRRLTVKGFTMYEWIAATSLLGKLRTLKRAQRRLATDLKSEIRATHSLAEHAAALALVRGATSDGKVLFVP
jgi:NADPH:quinone reductase-like Zn-dependent oxidoreductase